MRAVVIFESMYGNTHQVADAIGDGLSSAGLDVTVVPVSHVNPAMLDSDDLVVVGGPTHMHGMSRAASRKAAVKAAGQPASPLTVEPDALGPGLREWFDTLGRYPARAAAAFDTRLHGRPMVTGQAAKGVAHRLRAHAFHLVAEPESFLVTKQDRLDAGETARAREWGARLAASVTGQTAGQRG